MRAPAPACRGEGPHALWHVSEDPGLTRFAPHRAATALTDEPLVWAIDTRHLPLYWFPRDCPRCTFWAGERTTATDAERFLAGDRTARVHVIEDRWLGRVASAKLQLYRMPQATFIESADTAGYWVSREPVDALDRVTIGDLVWSPRRRGHRTPRRARALAPLGLHRGIDPRVQWHALA